MVELKVGVVDVFVIDPALGGWRVLILRRGEGTRCTGAWEVVHGRIEGGERPEEAAQRELREETGLAADRLYNVTCHPFYLHRFGVVQVAVVFAAFADSSRALTLGAEHDAAAWVSVDEALERLVWPRSRATLRDVYALLQGGDAGPVEDVLRIL
ncbi:MAG: NUDIX domain-containing protein [Gemmatimonadaceae bacterium]|nr:NUDIX domain-containing protein [Gemmatimonadaceae bacterium]